MEEIDDETGVSENEGSTTHTPEPNGNCGPGGPGKDDRWLRKQLDRLERIGDGLLLGATMGVSAFFS